MAKPIDFTVAIPTYNGADRLPKLLDKIRQQNQTENISWEVIVVDNNSNDHTAEVIKYYQSNWLESVPFKYCFEPKQGATFARQLAVKDILLFRENVIKDLYNSKNETLDLDTSITFDELIRYVVRTKDKQLDIHLKPQYLFLGTTKFDFIGKLEKIQEDFAYIKTQLKLPLYELPQKNPNQYTETPKNSFDIHWSKLTPSELKTIKYYPKYQEFYTEELRELVKKRYEKDLKMFGYEFTE